jgi:hypothetical protein
VHPTGSSGESAAFDGCAEEAAPSHQGSEQRTPNFGSAVTPRESSAFTTTARPLPARGLQSSETFPEPLEDFT